jgi:nitrogen fixation-related uncharacterized protein
MGYERCYGFIVATLANSINIARRGKMKKLIMMEMIPEILVLFFIITMGVTWGQTADQWSDKGKKES